MSETFYDPEGDGTRLASLGVHEHWNNPIDKQYSLNLGTGGGIELISSDPLACKGDFNGDGDVDGADLADVISGSETIDRADLALEIGRSDCLGGEV